MNECITLPCYIPSFVLFHGLVFVRTQTCVLEQSGVEVKNRKKRAEELLGIIGRLGPAIIKAGQALSSRPDLLPKEYLDELQKLQVTAVVLQSILNIIQYTA